MVWVEEHPLMVRILCKVEFGEIIHPVATDSSQFPDPTLHSLGSVQAQHGFRFAVIENEASRPGGGGRGARGCIFFQAVDSPADRQL